MVAPVWSAPGGRLRYSPACGSRCSDWDSSAVPWSVRCGRRPARMGRRRGRSPPGRRMERARHGRWRTASSTWPRHRPKRRSTVRTSSSWRDRRPTASRSSTSWRARGAGPSPRMPSSPTSRAPRRPSSLRATALGLRFVGGHPMAGRETERLRGVERRPVRRSAVGRRAGGGRGRGRARRATRRRPAARGPSGSGPLRTIGRWPAISHLPLVVAAALVEAVAGSRSDGPDADWPTAAALASTGWRDTTRLARGDADDGRRHHRDQRPGDRGARPRSRRRPRGVAGRARASGRARCR